jgi:MarR family transcriptional regulator, organic hydroperoxide resistance regulator
MPINFSIQDPVQGAWSLLQLTTDSTVKCAESAFSRIKLTPQQFSVLAAIKNIGDPVLPTEVAKWLDRNTNTITLIIDRMEKDGLVSRVRDLKDRRALRLLVSPKGQKLYEQALKPSRELPRVILSALTAEELKTLIQILDKIRQKTFEYRKVEDKVTNEKVLKERKRELKNPKTKKRGPRAKK